MTVIKAGMRNGNRIGLQSIVMKFGHYASEVRVTYLHTCDDTN